jgi:hypothetical protein
LAETRLSVPALGVGSGVPLTLGGGGALPAGVGAPPVSARTGVAKQARKIASATIDIEPPSQGLAPALPPTTYPLFRSPAELAVGLALKEMRYGLTFVRFAPGTCKAPTVPPLPSAVRLGFGCCWRGSIRACPVAGRAVRAEAS